MVRYQNNPNHLLFPKSCQIFSASLKLEIFFYLYTFLILLARTGTNCTIVMFTVAYVVLFQITNTVIIDWLK